MKKSLFFLSFSFLAITNSFAQNETKNEAQTDSIDEVVEGKGYNQWSIDLNGGFSKPATPFTPKYYVSNTNFYHADLGARYMFNTKFGLKLDVGIDQYKEGDGSLPFSGQYISTDLQGYVNLGRLMNFEEWTRMLNLQAHLGAGYAFMSNDNYDGTDNMVNMIVGLTGQIKISDRVALNADFSLINNINQAYTFDGVKSVDVTENRAFNGTIYNATLGVSIYLGKNEQHADWYAEEKVNETIANLESRVGELETMMDDSDKDGVPDYLDVELNSIPGVSVDIKGRMNDLNGNGVPDELEVYISDNYQNKSKKESVFNSPEMVIKLIDDGYVTTFFETNKRYPTNVSTEGIDFMLTFLRSNPTRSIEIYGNADVIGKSAYNDKLAMDRAISVKNILIKAGIAPERLITISNGVDDSVDPDSAGARRLVRRVTFRVVK